jgi:hypothetical protein
VLLLAGAALAGAPAEARAASVPSEDPGARARAILADPRYQTTLPEHAEPQELEEPASRQEPLPESGARVAVPVLGAAAYLTQIVFYVLAAVALLLVVGWIVQSLALRRRRGVAAAVEEGGGADAAGGVEREPDVEEAQRLAAEGRHGEAIHALLLAAIHHLSARSRVAVQPSRTSRELARLLPLPGEAKEAFNELVRAVELSLFGGEPAGPEDYERGLARFRALVVRRAA